MKAVEWVLRVAMFGEFLGHGILAYRGIPHFQELLIGATGLPPHLAPRILLLIGVIDLVIALVALLRPIRVVLLYAAVWGFVTALARPLSGVRGVIHFIERWPNWAVPLALLLVRGWPKQGRDWLR